MNMSASAVLEFGKDHGLIHEVVVTGRKVGAEVTFWSRLAHNENLFRQVVGEVMKMVVATRPFDPAQFIGEKWSLIAEERDERSASLHEADFSQVLLETCLREGEPSIKGEEKLIRLKAGKNIRLGATVFVGLWEDYQARKENSVLECFYKEQGVTYLDFFGDVLLGPGGGRYVLFFCRSGDGMWCWRCSWLGRGWSTGSCSASLTGQDLGLEVKSS